LIENQQIAKKVLNGHSGIYAFVYIPTGASYIGSSIDLGVRIMDHILNHSSNLHLQNAILKYGLSHFAFVILEYCLSSDLLKREQHFLDLLFSLAKELRYNFSPVAGAPIAGRTHTPETKAQMSDSKSGANNPMYGRTGANHPMFGKTHTPESKAKMSDSQQLVDRSGENNPIYGRTGALNPMYGRTGAYNPMYGRSGSNHPNFGISPANAMTINVYSVDNVLVCSFSSQVAAAKWLGVSNVTVHNYIKSGKVWNNLYVFRKSTLLK
jgi:group I intron endonuclease